MKGRLANGAAALCLLLSLSSLSVFVTAAEIEQNSVWMKARAGTANHGPEMKGVPAAAERQAGAAVGEDAVTDERHGRERRSVTLWRSSSSGLFNKRSGTASKFLTLSAIAAAVLMLSRLGGVLSSCLAEIGVLKPLAGPVSGASKNMCKELIGDVSEKDDRKPATSLARSVLPLRLPGGMSGQMLTVAVLLAVMAIGLAAPISQGPNESGVVGAQAGDDTAGTGAPDEGEIDDTTPSVEFQGDKVVIGRTWTTSDGTEKRGSMPAIKFSFEGKKYRIRLTEETRKLLEREGVLGRVRAILSKAPETTSEKKSFVWGKGEKDTVQVFSGDVYDKDDDTVIATWAVFLPKGAFGIQTGTENLDDEKTQEYFDFASALAEAVHIMKTGEKLAQ